MKHALRKAAVTAATVFAVASPALQNGLDWGQSASEFSASGDETLRAAGYAFSIWGLIYVGLVALAIYQAPPHSDGSVSMRLAGWPVAAANLGIGLWIWATASDQEWLTVVVIAGALTAAAGALVLVAPVSQGIERPLVVWPIAALAGWLTIAAVLNVLTVMTELGAIDAAGEVPAGVAGMAAAAGLAIMVLIRSRSFVYALPVAWGLVAVGVAEQDDNPVAAAVALAAAAFVLVCAGVLARRSKASAIVE